MSRNALAGTGDEIRLLSESRDALRAAVDAANRGRAATEADLKAVCVRLTAKTRQALPHDKDIHERITTAIESSFATALRSLNAHWDEIVKLLTDASERVSDALQAEKLAQRQRESEAIQASRAHAR
ncbi:hypothetical protein [Jiangella endophytica]|uniref:hypothetical protein n=1 Tax=Jiangella endophytica TaxID=1623398 RepID=UPI000E354B68|nr:hypothetical protein [Jiangella endophytica]